MEEGQGCTHHHQVTHHPAHVTQTHVTLHLVARHTNPKVFDEELEELEDVIRHLATAGVDALIVQVSLPVGASGCVCISLCVRRVCGVSGYLNSTAQLCLMLFPPFFWGGTQQYSLLCVCASIKPTHSATGHWSSGPRAPCGTKPADTRLYTNEHNICRGRRVCSK